MSDTKCQSLGLPEITGSEGAFSTPVLKIQIQVETLSSFIEPTHLCRLHSIKCLARVSVFSLWLFKQG